MDQTLISRLLQMFRNAPPPAQNASMVLNQPLDSKTVSQGNNTAMNPMIGQMAKATPLLGFLRNRANQQMNSDQY